MRSITALSLLFAIVGSQTINPTTVPIAIRDSWCVNQKTSCPLLCLQNSTSAATTQNSCDPTTLVWSCVCVNGQAPNISDFSQTIPYYECTESNTQCVAACGQDNTCSSACRDDHPCGAQNPTRVNTSSSTATQSGSSGTGSAGSATTTGYGTFGSATGSSAGSTGTAASKSAAMSALDLGRNYGFAILASGLFAGFAML